MDVARTRTGIKLRCTDIDILEDDMDDGNKTGMIRIPVWDASSPNPNRERKKRHGERKAQRDLRIGLGRSPPNPNPNPNRYPLRTPKPLSGPLTPN